MPSRLRCPLPENSALILLEISLDTTLPERVETCAPVSTSHILTSPSSQLSWSPPSRLPQLTTRAASGEKATQATRISPFTGHAGFTTMVSRPGSDSRLVQMQLPVQVWFPPIVHTCTTRPHQHPQLSHEFTVSFFAPPRHTK